MKTFKNSELKLLCDTIGYLPRHHNFDIIDNELVVYNTKGDYKTARFENSMKKTFLYIFLYKENT